MSGLPLLFLMAVTPQMSDMLEYGDHAYAIQQVPMLGLWDYSDDEPAKGKVKPPSFDVTSSANWKAYEAKWLVRDSKLYLQSITARQDGKPVKDGQIFPGKRFPWHARWFTGRIHIAVGGYDVATRKSESVIVFEVKEGNVVGTTFLPVYAIPSSWNGVATPDSDESRESDDSKSSSDDR